MRLYPRRFVKLNLNLKDTIKKTYKKNFLVCDPHFEIAHG